MKFLVDENFDNRIVRGLLHRRPQIDIVRAQDVEIAGAADPTLPAYASDVGRILLTHDARTIPMYAYERLAACASFAGVIVVDDKLSIGSVIDDLLVLIDISTEDEWQNQVFRLPI